MGKIRNILLIMLISFSYSCEEEGAPLTVQDLYVASNLPSKKFNVVLNGSGFETDDASGMGINQQLSLTAGDGIVSYVLSIKFRN